MFEENFKPERDFFDQLQMKKDRNFELFFTNYQAEGKKNENLNADGDRYGNREDRK